MTYLSSDDVTDLHEVVIDDICEVIGRVAIVLEDHLVIDILVVKHHLAVHDILERCLALRYLHTNDKRLSVRLLLFYLLFSKAVKAEAIIFGLGVLLSTDLNAHFL